MQSRRMSLIEAVTNNVVAFAISITVIMWLFPLFGFQVKLGESILIVMTFTDVSIIRSYILRRVFNAINSK